MELKSYLAAKKQLLNQTLLDFLDSQEKECVAFDYPVLSFLKEFVVSGKLYRGCLVFLGYDLFAQQSSAELSQEDLTALLQVASAVELTHSAFLLHDDMMDQDDLRRGQPTLHAKVMQENEGLVKDPRHYGYSQAISTGDLLIFWAGQLMHQASFAAHNTKLFSFYTQEMVKTGWGQMDDVALASGSEEAELDQILHVLSLKSGHYSVVNPILLGAITAGADPKTQQALTEFALNLGVMFQIKDDELGLFGSEKTLGKLVGSDIKENKKTLHRHFLFKLAQEPDKQQLNKIFGSSELSAKDLAFVRQKINQYQVLDEVNAQIEALKQEVSQALERLEVEESDKSLLKQLQQLLEQRKK